jgi:hypothetical protein
LCCLLVNSLYSFITVMMALIQIIFIIKCVSHSILDFIADLLSFLGMIVLIILNFLVLSDRENLETEALKENTKGKEEEMSMIEIEGEITTEIGAEILREIGVEILREAEILREKGGEILREKGLEK